MGLLSFFRRPRDTSANIAKERLQIVLSHERASRDAPDFLPILQKELVAVVARFVEVRDDTIRVNVGKSGETRVLEINIEIDGAKLALTAAGKNPLRSGAARSVPPPPAPKPAQTPVVAKPATPPAAAKPAEAAAPKPTAPKPVEAAAAPQAPVPKPAEAPALSKPAAPPAASAPAPLDESKPEEIPAAPQPAAQPAAAKLPATVEESDPEEMPPPPVAAKGDAAQGDAAQGDAAKGDADLPARAAKSS
jgi:cell division topological specificity factor